MHDDTIRVRQPGDGELLAWSRPIAAAFGEFISDEEFEFERVQLEPDRVIGAVDGEAWIGTGGAYSLRLTVPGGQVGAAGITMIGVAPSHTRRGALRQMMRWLLDQARDRGEPVAILWASESAIYQHFGYGMGTLQASFEIDRMRVRFNRPAEPLGRVRLLEREEAMTLLPPIYEARLPGEPGWVSRSETKWRHDMLADAEFIRRGNGPKFIAVLEVDGVARGYAIYRVKNDWDERGPNNTLLALEVTGLDAAAERAVWEWLFRVDLVARIKGWRGSPSHPLLLQLTEPRRLGMTVREGMWLRILDVAAALEGRRYARPGGFTFELTDAFYPTNAGRWRLEVSGEGAASVTPSSTDADLVLDVSDLAAVYLGAFTIADLARAGRVRECRSGAIAAADRLFATGVTPWCSTMF
jgi:predicted acetyltransferase